MGSDVRRVDLFPTLDGDGVRLATLIGDAVREVSPRAAVRTVSSTGPETLLRSLVTADVVILDLTPAPDGTHRYTTAPYPWHRPYVLAVSRTYLPINVSPARVGGAAVYPGRMTDEAIAEWVRVQLTGPDAPRARSLAQKAFGWIPTGGPDRGGSDVFISYRTRDLGSALRLRDALRAGDRHGPAKSVHLYEPGQLATADEVLPPLLRWNVLAVISDDVRRCSGLWVVDTPGYLASWWTQGELLCVPYLADHVTVRRFDPATGEVRDDDGRYSATLTDAQRGRMARLFSNSHSDLMAPESSEAMRRMRPAGLPMAGDDVFDEEFSYVPLLQCPSCSLTGAGPTRLDVERFLANREPSLYPLPPEQLREGARIACSHGCGQMFTIVASPPRYLWSALPIGPANSCLVTIPTYSAIA